MRKHLFSLLLITSGTSLVSASCFSNSTALNSTASPCFAGAYGQGYRPSSPYYPPVYPNHEIPAYRPQYPYPQQHFHGSNVLFPQTYPGHQHQQQQPYYRPAEVPNSGYSYPADYRGPVPDWNQPNYSNHLSQPPARYAIGYDHANPSPVNPAFQRRTYLTDYRQTPSKEPVFMDRGTVAFVGRDVELSCAFYDNRFRIISNVAWVKVTGPYEHGALHPPFECHRPGCHYLYINGINDFRFRVITLGQTSTLRIYDHAPADQGIYRCAATAQGPDGYPVTVYKVIEFFTHHLNQRQQFGRK